MPSLTICWMLQLVAQIRRTSIGRSRVSPTRVMARFWSARKSLACKCNGILPISSKKSVPPLACSNLPIWSACASVKAPLTCPKSSLSKSVSVMAPASTHTIGWLERVERRCISLAITSFPVPFSPVMSTEASVGAKRSICLRIARIAEDEPQWMFLGDEVIELLGKRLDLDFLVAFLRFSPASVRT